MEKIEIQKDIIQFSSFIEPINMSFNQFLLLGSEPILIHTGTAKDVEAMIPYLHNILGNNELKYVFISHFESDECGGLSLLLSYYKNLKPICSGITGRQLSGFGITSNALVQSPNQTIHISNYEFEFINYPSEMHLWDGLIFYEKNSGYLFSSDLFTQMGKSEKNFKLSNWPELVSNIPEEKIPNQKALETLKNRLLEYPVHFIAPGHGTCIEIKK